jgi:hypothetical protein
VSSRRRLWRAETTPGVQPLVRELEHSLVGRYEDPVETRSKLEERCVLRALAELVGGVEHVPAALAQASDDRSVYVLVGEEREALRHYWFGWRRR